MWYRSFWLLSHSAAESTPSRSSRSSSSGVKSALAHSLSPSLLEVRSGVEYTLVTTEVPTPDDLRPPHPEEAGLFARSEAAARTTMRARSGLSAEGATSYEDGLERVGRYLDEQSPASLVDQAYLLAERGDGVIQPRDRGLVEDPHFVWGAGRRRASIPPPIGKT